jgi:hypothetical protein
MVRQTQGNQMQIVIAKVEMTGLEATGRFITKDRNLFPEFRAAPEAKAAMWLRKGTPADVAKAKAAMESEGYKVFTFDSAERDPLGKAKEKVLRG